MVKIGKNMSYDKEVIKALERKAKSQERSTSYIANKILRENLIEDTREDRKK